MKNHNKQSQRGRLSWMLSGVLKSKKAEGYVDTAVKVLIAVVVGALLLFGIVGLMENVVLPTTTSKVESLFSVEGTAGGAGGVGGGGIESVNIKAGANQRVEKTDAGTVTTDLTVSSNTDYSGTPDDVAVSVDDIAVSPDHYNIVRGSTQVTLSKGFLSTLPVGEHTMEIVSSGEPAVTTFTVAGPVQYSGLVVVPSTDGVTFTDKDNQPVDTSTLAVRGLKQGDTVVYGDFTYKYQRKYFLNGSPAWVDDANIHWAVKATDQAKSSYGELCGEIFGEPVDCMSNTFFCCSNLTASPKIPASVKDMQSTFQYGGQLTEAPIIPYGVENMSTTFFGQTNLTTSPIIPASVRNMECTFYGCSKLKTVSSIANGVIDMHGCFSLCDLSNDTIAQRIILPTTVKNLTYAFSGSKMKFAPLIPSGTENMTGTFAGCLQLSYMPIDIPSSVTNIEGLFNGCKALGSNCFDAFGGLIYFHGTPTSYSGWADGTTKSITIWRRSESDTHLSMLTDGYENVRLYDSIGFTPIV